MFGPTAIKAGLAAAVDTQAVRDIVMDDARFQEMWSVVAAVPGSFAEVNAAALFSLLRALPIARVVEIGSYLGRSTVFFARTLQILNAAGPNVFAIDPHTGDRQQLQALGTASLPSFDLFNAHIDACSVRQLVTPIVKSSSDAASGWTQKIDLLYVDGWHSYDAVMRDGRDWLPHLSPFGMVCFDDYARYEEVQRAVDELAGEGQFVFWGNVFGQAIGGRGSAPNGTQRLLTIAGRPLTRRLHRVRRQ